MESLMDDLMNNSPAQRQKVGKRNSMGGPASSSHSGHRRPSLLSTMKVYKGADEQKTNQHKPLQASKSSIVSPSIYVQETTVLDEKQPMVLLQAASSSAENPAGGNRFRSSSFSRHNNDASLLKPVSESDDLHKSSLKCPSAALNPKSKSGPRRNSFCVSMEVKQKQTSLKTLGLFK
ncbi:uncharacterized protein LOC134853944 [Symsagittifera roscoffensis]|uniref:uncharacterized protein LOC134853944 n=1 Tax=Symsagittifera roscoffensis TaxID=84072 RepID=UPI00307B7545